MRCADVIQELATPHGRDPASLAEHLARCPRCADRARQGARLDRLWAATRPEEPGPAAWEAVWARVTHDRDASASPALPWRPWAAPQSRPWLRRGIVAIGIAQAAVLLVAAWLVSRPDPESGRPPRGVQARVKAPTTVGPELARKSDVAVPKPMATAQALAPDSIEIDYGALVMIQSSPQGVTVVSHANDEASGAVAALGAGPVDGNFLMLNILEAMAK